MALNKTAKVDHKTRTGIKTDRHWRNFVTYCIQIQEEHGLLTGKTMSFERFTRGYDSNWVEGL